MLKTHKAEFTKLNFLFFLQEQKLMHSAGKTEALFMELIWRLDNGRLIPTATTNFTKYF